MQMTTCVFESPGFGYLAGWLGREQCRRVLVLAPPSRRFVDPLVTAIGAFTPEVFDGARVHVPVEVAEAARLRLAETGADAIVAIGGGSPIGLGKALRLHHDVRFVAIPTTYAGSERTQMYGITTGSSKQTGRDPRVRPDLVIYDVALTREIPLALSVQSLCNALAHVVSAMSTGSIEGAIRSDGLAAGKVVLDAIDELLADPRALTARDHAQRGASSCAAVYDHGKPGIQHALAHLLGGATRLDHAALHSILLPRFVTYLRDTQPALVVELEAALARPGLDAHLVAVLERAGAPTTLSALGVTPQMVRDALATRPDLPVQIAERSL
jgi:maleylacetate reductase